MKLKKIALNSLIVYNNINNPKNAFERGKKKSLANKNIGRQQYFFFSLEKFESQIPKSFDKIFLNNYVGTLGCQFNYFTFFSIFFIMVFLL